MNKLKKVIIILIWILFSIIFDYSLIYHGVDIAEYFWQFHSLRGILIIDYDWSVFYFFIFPIFTGIYFAILYKLNKYILGILVISPLFLRYILYIINYNIFPLQKYTTPLPVNWMNFLDIRFVIIFPGMFILGVYSYFFTMRLVEHLKKR